jgi:hypothetical protein
LTENYPSLPPTQYLTSAVPHRHSQSHPSPKLIEKTDLLGSPDWSEETLAILERSWLGMVAEESARDPEFKRIWEHGRTSSAGILIS